MTPSHKYVGGMVATDKKAAGKSKSVKPRFPGVVVKPSQTQPTPRPANTSSPPISKETKRAGQIAWSRTKKNSMNYLSWMTTFLLIGLTVQRSLPTDEDNDSLDFLSEDIALGAKDSELSEEDNSLEEQFTLVSMLLDQVILNTLKKTNNILERNTKKLNKLRSDKAQTALIDSDPSELLLVGRRPRRGRRHQQGGGRGRGDLIPYPRVG